MDQPKKSDILCYVINSAYFVATTS